MKNGRTPTLDESVRILGEQGNQSTRILADAIREVFNNTNMTQRSVLTPKLANALIRAEAYCKFYKDKESLKLVEKIYEIVVSFQGKGRRDMREAIASALGIAIRSGSTPTDSLLGMKRDV